MKKLVHIIAHIDDARKVVGALTGSGFDNTYTNTTGGFAAKENVTIMCVVEDDKIDRLLKIVRQNIKQHRELPTKENDLGRITTGAVAFISDLDRFERLNPE